MSPPPPAGAGDEPGPAPAGHHPALLAGLVRCPVCLREIPSPDGVHPYGHSRRDGAPVPLRGLDGRVRWEWRRVPCPDAVTPRVGDVQQGYGRRR